MVAHIGWLRRGIGSALVAMAALEVVRSGVSSSLPTSRHGAPWERLAFRSPLASLRAQQALADGDLVHARQHAVEAVAGRPADAVAIRILGLVASRTGQRQQASELMLAAAQWGWRDTPTQEWLFQNSIQAGDDQGSIIYGQALVSRGQFYDEVFPEFVRLTIRESNWPLLSDALSSGIRWRSQYYAYLLSAPLETFRPLTRFMRYYSQTGAKLARKDLQPFLEALLAAGMNAEARELWMHTGKLPGASGITDGGFSSFSINTELPPPSDSFDWNFDPSSEMFVTADPDKHGNKVLAIETAGNGRAPIAVQRLIPPTGQWVLSFRMKAVEQQAELLLKIGVACDGQGRKMADAVTLSGAQEKKWQQIAVRVSTTRDCPRQWLAIISPGSGPGDPVGVLLDDFRATRETNQTKRILAST